MKVDIHTHLWPAEKTTPALMEYFFSRGMNAAHAMSAEGLVQAEEGICDMAVIATLAPGGNTTNAELESYHSHVTRHVKNHPGKLLALCTIDPHDVRCSVSYIENYIESWGFAGLKLHPNIQEFYPNDPSLFPVYGKMQEYGLPVLFHTGGIGVTPFLDKYGDCACLEEVACRFPGLVIIMGHAGRGKYVDTASMLRKHPNVYADISANFAKLKGQEHGILLELIKTVKLWTGGTQKLLFGSDYPFYYPAQTSALLDSIQAMEPDIVTPEDVEKIRNENAYAFMEKYVFQNKHYNG